MKRVYKAVYRHYVLYINASDSLDALIQSNERYYKLVANYKPTIILVW